MEMLFCHQGFDGTATTFGFVAGTVDECETVICRLYFTRPSGREPIKNTWTSA